MKTQYLLSIYCFPSKICIIPVGRHLPKLSKEQFPCKNLNTKDMHHLRDSCICKTYKSEMQRKISVKQIRHKIAVIGTTTVTQTK